MLIKEGSLSMYVSVCMFIGDDYGNLSHVVLNSNRCCQIIGEYYTYFSKTQQLCITIIRGINSGEGIFYCRR